MLQSYPYPFRWIQPRLQRKRSCKPTRWDERSLFLHCRHEFLLHQQHYSFTPILSCIPNFGVIKYSYIRAIVLVIVDYLPKKPRAEFLWFGGYELGAELLDYHSVTFGMISKWHRAWKVSHFTGDNGNCYKVMFCSVPNYDKETPWLCLTSSLFGHVLRPILSQIGQCFERWNHAGN